MIQEALSSNVIVWVVRILALTLAYGSIMHTANILDYGEKPWLQSPLSWRIMDVVLLIFNVCVGLGLWFKQSWAVVGFFAGIVLLQIVPYTIFKHYFIITPEHATTLNGMVIFWFIILIFVAGMFLWQGYNS